VRRFGKSYAHPLIVLLTAPNQLNQSRFGVAAGRSIGKAVQRNRAKRLLREALRPLLPMIETGWDVLLISRYKMNEAKLEQVEQAMIELLQRAGLYRKDLDETTY